MTSKYGLISILGLVGIAAMLIYWGVQHQQSAKVLSTSVANKQTVKQNIAVDAQAASNETVVMKDAAEQLLEKRLAITQQWLRINAPNTITLQIMTSADENKAKSALESLSHQIEIDNVYLYHQKQNGVTLTVFLYGAYQQRSDALAAVQALPAQLKNNRPQLRTLLGINNELEQKQ
jgi:DamX protein